MKITIDGRPVPPWWVQTVQLLESLPDTSEGREMGWHILQGLLITLPPEYREDIDAIAADLLSIDWPSRAAHRLDELTDDPE